MQKSFVRKKKELPLHRQNKKTYKLISLGYGVMVTQQILVLFFLVRIRVAQHFKSAVFPMEGIQIKFGLWCNGNTTDSGPVFPGSNPGSPTVRAIRLNCSFFMSA